MLRSDEKLKIQLMGRDWVKRQERKGGNGSGSVPLRLGNKPKPAATERVSAEEESEDDGGRSSLGRHKAPKAEAADLGCLEKVDDGDDTGLARSANVPKPQSRPKRPTSYLDEMLAKRAEKEHKKRRRKGPA